MRSYYVGKVNMMKDRSVLAGNHKSRNPPHFTPNHQQPLRQQLATPTASRIINHNHPNNNVSPNNSTRQSSTSHQRSNRPLKPRRPSLRSGMLPQQNRQLSPGNRNGSLRSPSDDYSVHECVQGTICQVISTPGKLWDDR